jgi:hypothetical protein
MSRNYQPVELNTFVGGLITEASPLTFPQNASLDELNFVLDKDGSRSRRLGMDMEDGFRSIQTGNQFYPGTNNYIVNSFKWDNVGGDPSMTILVIQTGQQVDFIDGSSAPYSANVLSTFNFNAGKRLSFAAVDGKLVLASGDKNISVFSYDKVSKTVSMENKKLLIRDLFGLEDIDPTTGTDLRAGTGISTRPRNDGSGLLIHMYNLKNQTWAIPRPGFDNLENPTDMLNQFFQYSGGVYPSNADNSLTCTYPDTNSKKNKTLVRFDPKNSIKNPAGTLEAPRGYFIIDALDRGVSRAEEITKLYSKYPGSNPNTTTAVARVIPADSTPSGATCVAEFAGRVWYAGFSGEVVGGDKHSPKMSSYILFSQLVKDITDIASCYQEADPTDKDNSDLVDTDGGFLRVQGAYNIVGMNSLGSTLFVFAQNGVWSITGGNSYGFTATNYKISKITNAGCISPGSIVVVENSIYYWSRDGIYNISANQYGDYNATSITAKTIQKYYNSIPEGVAKYSEGVYDSFEKKVKWLYYNSFGLEDVPTELNLDLALGAFYKFKIKPSSIGSGMLQPGYPIVAKAIQVNPFSYSYEQTNVVVNNAGTFEDVYVGVNNVVVDNRVEVSGTKEVLYLIILGPYNESTQSYSFGSYSNVDHYDFYTLVATELDAESYLITGYLSGGDYQRNKQIVYLTVHCKRTETPGVEGGPVTNPSSCLTQVQWDWTNSSDSWRWGRQFQAYRLFGPYYPAISTDARDTFNVVETRSKIRGQGKVISMKFNSEPGHHLTLLGWSLTIGIPGNV